MAEWLMMPYSFAAPRGDTQYNVGGTLSYIVGAVNFSVPLLPDTITVKPTPSLIVHYFLEKYVRGDDPLTQIVEPVIPFTLAIMVMNDGYGVAHALRLTSAQPEIIENTKGLLIAFKILGSEIGNKHVQPSMTVDFGDIKPFETKTARWLLECPLKGTFSNYSATFENVNPLGDPQLSLLDELDYHELVHRVQIQNSPSGAGAFDNLDDYLVNDELDDAEFPDRLYNSANGSDIQPVFPSIVKNFALHKTVLKSSSKAYTVVLLRVSVNSSAWYYTRVINNLTSSVPQDDQLLIQVFREDGKTILVEKNAWQTTHILDSFLYHMLDYSNLGENEEAEISYYLTFGPRNMHPPKFNSSEYSGIVSADAPNDTTVIKLAAYDIDGDSYLFKLGAHNVSIFSIHQTGEVKVSGLISTMGLVTIEAIVEDDGIPARSSTTLVTIEVPDEASLLLSTVSTPGISVLERSSIYPTGSSSIESNSKSPVTGVTRSTTHKESMFPLISTQFASKSYDIKSTSSSISEGIFTTSMISNGEPRPGQEYKLPQWIVPTAIGAACFIFLFGFFVGLVCALKRNAHSN